jgi:hypothetical protein
VLSPIDLPDARKLRASQPPDLDAFLHHATIARTSSRLAPRPRCTHTPDPNSHERAITVVIRVIEDHRAASGSYNARYMGDLR